MAACLTIVAADVGLRLLRSLTVLHLIIEELGCVQEEALNVLPRLGGRLAPVLDAMLANEVLGRLFGDLALRLEILFIAH